MIRMLNAYTLEVDDAQYALDEILEQLDLDTTLLKNSVGIIACHSDFIQTGVAGKIAEMLPFDVIGGTSLATATAGEDDSLMLSLSVLTSDDLEFTTFSASGFDQPDSIEKAYNATKKEGKSALVIPFIPLLISVAHEQIMLELDKAVDGAPIFGTVVADHTADYSTCHTLINGDATQNALVALAIWGDFEPTFCFSEMSEKYIQHQRAVITKSAGNMVMEVNGVTLPEYLESIGVTKGRGVEALGGVPFLIDFGDGTRPVARGIHTITPEGYGLFGGIMPENATLAIGSVERDDVLRLTRETLQAALDTGKTQGLLMFPCASHFLVLGADAQAQKDIIKQMVPASIPYQLCYSGGEVCPVYDQQGNTQNRFHSYTFVACIF